MKTLLRSFLFACVFLTTVVRLSAFQFADGAAPAHTPVPKFIFYWGQQQCDLTAEQDYKGRFSMRPAEFRQMLLSAPKLWNGSALVTDFTFQLQAFQVQTKMYLSQIAALDQQFGQPVAGQMLRIDQLVLGNGAKAVIDVEIVAPEKEQKAVFGAQGYAPFLNTQLLETVTWGQEDKLDISQRDFFTVSEFWEIFGQEPYLEWHSLAVAVPVMAELQFLDAEGVTQSIRSRLEEVPYTDFVRMAQVYHHLFKPGARATLLLQTVDQYERLYQKSLQLVSDNDERLKLRRNRNVHNLTIQWATWSETIENMYLMEVIDDKGVKQSADQPVNRWAFVSEPNSLSLWSRQGPEFRVDNELISTASYTIQKDSLSYRVENGKFDSLEFQRVFLADTLNRRNWKITDVELPGYALPYLQYSFQSGRLLGRDQFFLKNNISTLLMLTNALPNAPGFTIKAPVKEGNEWKFDMELPQRTDLIISIFNSEKWNIYWEDFITDAGKTTHAIPAGSITEKGKYMAFLISPLGVARVDFELP